jgi:hypothetical protein
MRQKRTIEEEINEFLEVWGEKQTTGFFEDILPLLELYNIEEGDDWVMDEVGGDKENVRTIRITRTVYLISRIAAFHAAKLCSVNCNFKDLWKRMERHAVGQTT